MRNIESAGKFHLGLLLTELQQGTFVIPDFQREFEWDASDVNDLMKSIFLDYYIGTLLLWKASPENLKILSCEPIYGHTGNRSSRHIVLDGQQRLTAIYYAFFGPEKPFPKRVWKVYFLLNVKHFMEENYDEAFTYFSGKRKHIVGDTTRQYEEHYFPLSNMGRDPYAVLDWVREYKDHWNRKLDSVLSPSEQTQREVRETIENAIQFEKHVRMLLNEYFISFIELDRDIHIEKVCEIFTQINSKGVQLNMFDLLNAILRPHNIYLKELWRKYDPEITYTEDPRLKSYVIQVMSILLQSYCSSKYLYYLVPKTAKTIKHLDGSMEQVVLISDHAVFEEKWFEAFYALKRGLSILESSKEYGAILSKFLPYLTITPVFSAIHEHIRQQQYNDMPGVRKKIKIWYWSNVFLQNYSSAVESKSAKDFKQLQEWFVDNNAKPEIVSDFEQKFEELDFKSVVTQTNAIYNAVINLLIIKGARDWANLDLPDYSELDDHHIVPQSWGKKQKVPFINSILNKTLLSPTTNRHILSDRMPNVYIAEMFEKHGQENVRTILRTHLISDAACDILLRKKFTQSDYAEFLHERHKSVIEAIQDSILDGFVPEKSPEFYQSKISKLEIALRDFIANKLNDRGVDDPYKTFVPTHVQDRIKPIIQNHLRDHPNLTIDDFKSLRSVLDHADLQHLKDIMTSKDAWPLFESHLGTKEIVNTRFGQLGPLRNAIAHSRTLTEIIRQDGNAAIAWFENLLRTTMDVAKKKTESLENEEVDDESVRTETSVDRDYWVNKRSEESLQLADRIVECLCETGSRYEMAYRKSHIKVATNGEIVPFIRLRIWKNFVGLVLEAPRLEEIDKIIKDSNLEFVGYMERTRRYRIRIRQSDIERKKTAVIALFDAVKRVNS